MQKRFDELKSTGQLPSPTGVAVKILRLAQLEDVNLSELVRIIKGDPAMAGRLLQLSNSVFYASNRAITSVDEAVARLGLNVVWKAALGFSVISRYRRGNCRHFKYDEFWSNSLAVAVSAQTLSHAASLGNPEEAFACGLLSQIGRLALASLYPDIYDRLLVSAPGKTPQAIRDLEQQAFAMDHCELTAAMLADWGIAPIWVQAVHEHEDPDSCELPKNLEHHKLTLMLHLASQIAGMYFGDLDSHRQTLQQFTETAETLRIDGTKLASLCDDSAREWNNWGKVLGIHTQPVPSFASLLENSHQAEEEVSGASPEAPPPPVSHPPHFYSEPNEIRLLLVTGDSNLQPLLEEKLPEASRILCAHNNHGALRTALEIDPHIIVADWAAPGIDGLGLCKSLRKSKAGQQVYILLLAEKQDDEAMAAALAAGANEYIRKPLNPSILESRLNVALRVVRLQQELLGEQEQIRHQLTQMAVLNRTLERDALTDPLTGLPNRRYAMARLCQEWAASERNHAPLSCLYLDLDHFKRVNDTCGHDAGDHVLAETALVLKKALRASDIVCRIGGEEFLVICRDTDLPKATQCAERLIRSVEEHCYYYSGTRIRITISAGVAERTSAMADSEELMKAADTAAYDSKAAGRNRCTVACA